MTDRTVQRVRTRDPNGVALATMGRVARDTANTWTMKEWASRLAAQAGPRDYLGQLKALYDGILSRWRYVMEPGEWVAGTPRALLGNVLGLSYTQPNADPTRCRVDDASTPQTRGWGDCDDVSALCAAGALALGFEPSFRVARGAISHVSTIVKIPGGRHVSIDPVGHPHYPFGWAVPSNQVEIYTLSGQPALVQPTKELSGMNIASTVSYPTLFSGVDTYLPKRQTQIGHWCACPKGDHRGPRVLAMPDRFHRLFMSGIVVDGAPAVDENGESYRYDALRDIWIDDRVAKSQAGAMGAGFFSRMRRRWKKRIAGVRKIIQRVAQPIRALIAKAALSPVVQNVVGAALMSVGIPRAATKAVLEASGEILRKGGIPALIRMIRKDPKAALRMVAQAAKSGLKRATQIFSGIEDEPQYTVYQSGGQFSGQPVMALVGVPYVADFGEVEISEAPSPGRWYRIKKGDTLLSVTSAAYGVPAGSQRLARAKWINEAHANAPFFDPSAKDNLFKKGKISFAAKWASDPQSASQGATGKSYAVIWIPTTLGDEPSAAIPGKSTTPTTTPTTTPDIPLDSTRPRPGAYYQVKKGDTLLAVAGSAYGVPSGSARLERARWINNALANASFVKKSLADKTWPGGRISFSPPYPSIWIPLSKGDEPTKPDKGDLPPEDPKPPKDPDTKPDDLPDVPDRPTDEDEKLKKFREACERTPNGHFVTTQTGPGCMVCHPEKGEVWDAIAQRCVVKTTPQVDPFAEQKMACAVSGGTWDALSNTCRVKQIPHIDPFAQEKAACAAAGGTWDSLANTCRIKQLPDVNDDVERDACLAKGGAWDPQARACRIVDIDPGPGPGPDKDEKKSSLLPLAMGVLALMALGGK